MSTVVGIHGIAQQWTTGPELRQSWEAAIEGALEVAEDPDRRRIRGQIEVAAFGPLFRPAGALAADGPPPIPTEFTPDERAFIAALHEAATEQEPEIGVPPGALGPGARAGGRTAGVMVNALLRSRLFAGISEIILRGNVRQAINYLNDDETHARVNDLVMRQISDDTRILIGHSMGSIVAYQILVEGRAPQVQQLITLGSPLGLPNVVFHRLKPAPKDGQGLWPDKVQSWVNIADNADYVAAVKRLEPLFAASAAGHTVQDVPVHNGDEPHGAIRYLNSRQLGEAIGPWF